MELKNLDIYRLARKLSAEAWKSYTNMDWETRKIIGYQWIRSVDSIGANIAEGHGRFHYLDKNKFNLNARGSLAEAVHWTELLKERKIISDQGNSDFFSIIDEFFHSYTTFESFLKYPGT